MRPEQPAGTYTDENATVPERLPRERWQHRELVIWGAHGGAGTTALATWLRPAWDMGAMHPEPNPQHPAAVRLRLAAEKPGCSEGRGVPPPPPVTRMTLHAWPGSKLATERQEELRTAGPADASEGT